MVDRLTFVSLETNSYNGFFFNLLDIDYKGFEGALFSLSFGYKRFLIVELFFMKLVMFDKTN
jgi:hypothetical protein